MSDPAVMTTALNELLAFVTNGLVGARIHLYVNPWTPTDGDTLANYTEASFPGYAPIAVPTWSPPTTSVQTASSFTSTVYFVLTNSAGGPYNVQGYFVTDSGGALVWAQRDPAAPVQLVNVGDGYPLTLAFSVTAQS